MLALGDLGALGRLQRLRLMVRWQQQTESSEEGGCGGESLCSASTGSLGV